MSSNKRRRNFPDGFDIDMRPLHDFMKKMDDLFQDSFKHLNNKFHLKSFWLETEETETEVIVKAELPGYSREQIEIEMIGNMLRISVEDKSTIEGNDESNQYYSKQESFQRKERVVTVPFAIPEKETKASFHNGLLKVVIPKNKADGKYLDIE